MSSREICLTYAEILVKEIILTQFALKLAKLDAILNKSSNFKRVKVLTESLKQFIHNLKILLNKTFFLSICILASQQFEKNPIFAKQ